MATEESGSSTRKSTGKKSTGTGTKSAGKKSTGTRKTAATTSSAGKSTGSKKASTSKSTAGGSTSRASAPRAEARPTPSATELARSAAAELLELTGKQPEGITGLERTDDGWTVQVEVVEVRRIPDTTDVLALYEISTDDRGRLQGYRRLKRYARGVPGED